MHEQREQIISFKYDGTSKSIKKHQMDVRVLAATLDSFADLISAADEAIHKRPDGTKVEVKAEFVPGSFGIEFIVFADPDVLAALGVMGAYIGGSAVSVLNELKGAKVKTIEIDETNDQATIVTAKGERIETSIEVASLIKDPEVRAKLDKLVFEPLSHEGITSVSVYPGSPLDLDIEPSIEVDTARSVYFKKPAVIEARTRKEVDTIGKIEFISANKDSGTSGWRINYLSYTNVPVKIIDEGFLAKIKYTDSPAIFAQKFSAKLIVVTTKLHDEVINTTFTIEKVLGPVDD